MKGGVFNSIIGRTIYEMRVMSFYINRKLICDMLVLYIKVNTGEWYKFTSSDGQNEIELIKEDPKEVVLDEIEDEFAYPIRTVNLCYRNKTIKEIKEYVWKNCSDELVGFYIELTDSTGFSFINSDDNCSKIFDGFIIDDCNYQLC